MRRYLVTGASSGIGRAIALKLASEKNEVIALGRNEKRLEMLSAEEDNIIPFVYDLMDLENIEEIFIFCKNKGIKLDGFIHSAGVSQPLPIGVNDTQSMIETMTVNCFAFAELVKYFSKRKYSNDNSSVIGISSLAAKTYGKSNSNYVASKCGLNGMVKVLAKELVKRQIKVNAIMPAFVDTALVHEMDNEIMNLNQQVEQRQPLGIIMPEDVANLTSFLLSEEARMITGAIIPISAGLIV